MENKIGILIIDDRPDMLRSLGDVLQVKGYRVSIVQTGYEALERVKKVSFDLVIMDIKMPEMDGTELIKRIKEINSEIGIIIKTGYPFRESNEEVTKFDINEYITEPFEMEEMLLAIKRSVERQKLLKEKKELRQDMARADMRLEELRERLFQSSKLSTIGRLAAGSSHELKNLLGIINVSRYYIGEKVGKEDQKIMEHLETIRRNVDRSDKIIVNLLGLARQGKPNIVPADVNKLLDEVLSVIEYQMSLQNIKVITEYGSRLQGVSVDVEQIKQVFLNIILNAQEAMSDGGELRISTSHQPEAEWKGLPEEELKVSGFVEIRFSDTGCGIPAENLKSIFNPFFTTKDINKSAGLGLSISDKIIKGYDGRINVESKVGEGTIFSVRLPAEGKASEQERSDL